MLLDTSFYFAAVSEPVLVYELQLNSLKSICFHYRNRVAIKSSFEQASAVA